MEEVRMSKNEQARKKAEQGGSRLRSSSVVSSESSRGSPGSPSKSRRKSTSLPPETVDYLKKWMMSPEHIAHPYPTDQEKAEIMADTGIELKQLTNWFVNNRKRYWKPRVEARLQEQAQVQSVSTTLPARSLIKPDGGLSLVRSPPRTTSSFTKVVSSPSVSALLANSKAISLVSPMNSPGRIVSEHASSASETESVGSLEQDDLTSSSPIATKAQYTKYEQMNVHVLRPVSGREPSLEDVTVLPNIPQERILRTFEDCEMSYQVPSKTDRKKEQNRRDAEIVRLKKHYLKMYLAEAASETLKRKRTVAMTEEEADPSPRRRYRRVSIDVWKHACQSADSVYSESLPSLEEATQLFGYSG